MDTDSHGFGKTRSSPIVNDSIFGTPPPALGASLSTLCTLRRTASVDGWNSCHTVLIRVHPCSSVVKSFTEMGGEFWRDASEISRDRGEICRDGCEISRDPHLANSRQISAILAKTQCGENFRAPNRLPISSNSVFNP